MFTLTRFALLVVLLAPAAAAFAQPQPVPPSQRIPVDVRRATLIVRDM